MTHVHSWTTIESYPSDRGYVYKKRCEGCGKVKKRRYDWTFRPLHGRDGAGVSGAVMSGFLVGVGFTIFVFAVAVLRGCV